MVAKVDKYCSIWISNLDFINVYKSLRARLPGFFATYSRGRCLMGRAIVLVLKKKK